MSQAIKEKDSMFAYQIRKIFKKFNSALTMWGSILLLGGWKWKMSFRGDLFA